MTASETALQVDWLGLCRRAADGLERMLSGIKDTGELAAETGTRGAGGDRTLVLDHAAEEIVFAELEALHRDGLRFTAISEERGEQPFGADPGDAGAVRVVIDPIDGSTNAKRGLPHSALSIAVADGPTMADVAFGFVCDLGSGEQWWARRREGAWRAAVRRGSPSGEAGRLDPAAPGRRSPEGRMELVGVEATDPRRVQTAIADLCDVAYRLRAIGSIAITLCEVAAAHLDGMLTLRGCRGVDAAAGQLIVREAGGLVAFDECDSPLGAPLDATAGSRLLAARSAEGLRLLQRVTR